ncbi:hypothetical protein [Paenibacillus foliorum]|nr:hypothetical protein [Paenibacillus foliorum]
MTSSSADFGIEPFICILLPITMLLFTYMMSSNLHLSYADEAAFKAVPANYIWDIGLADGVWGGRIG